MDVQYGISITNKYDLFFDEDQDPLELISAQKTTAATKEEKAAKKKEKKQLKSAKEAAPVAPVAPVAPAKPTAKLPVKPTVEHKEGPDEKENKPMAPRRGGGRPPGGEQRPPRPPRQEGDAAKRTGQYQDDVPPRFAGGQEDRGGFGDRFGERGPPGDRGRGRGRGGPRGRGRGEGRGRGGFGGENRSGAEPAEGGGDIFQQADDNSWNAGGGEAQQHRGGFNTGPQANADENRGGFGQADGGGRGGFGTFGDEETERLSGARPPNRGGFGNRGGRGRGNFNSRGGEFPRGGRGGRGGRQFDRHSGSDSTFSGIKPVEKREGGGPHNWGTINDELTGETEALNNTVGSDEVPAERGERNEPREGEAEPQEDVVQEFTLDEWKALQQKEKEAKPQFNIRKPGDGEDPTLWKKLIPLAKEKPKEQKQKKSAQDVAVEEEEDEEIHPKKQLLNIEINFIDTSGHGGGRGGPPRGGSRGFGRGGRGGEGGRGAPSIRSNRGGGPGVGRGTGGGGRGAPGGRRDQNFKMDDESFPELSSAAGPTA